MPDSFELLASGVWPPARVDALYDPAAVRLTAPHIEMAIEAAWQRALAQAAKAGQHLFNGRLCRLASFDPSGQILRLTLGPTAYRDYIGTNVAQPTLPAEYLADPPGICIVLRTADARLVLARRSRFTHGHPGFLHLPAGHIEQDRHVRGSRVDIFAAIVDEVVEEIRCDPADVIEPVCLGLARAADTRKPEILFAARLRRAWAEIGPMPHNQEHDEITSIADTPEAIGEFLAANSPCIVPVAQACLVEYARHRRGGSPLWWNIGLPK